MRGADEKELPNSPEAERATLGSCIIDPDAVPVVATVLSGPGDFHDDKNRWAWEAILALHRDGAPVDVLTVSDRMEADGTLQAAGGPAFLTELSLEVPTSVHAKHYARIVERTATRRRLIAAGASITRAAFDESRELSEVEDEAARAVLEARSRQHRQSQPASDLVSSYYDRLEMMMRDGKPPGLPTGFTDLDKLLGGLQKSDFVVLAGRPSMGKTALALGIARHAAQKFGAKVAFFSLEMSDDQVIQRFVAIESAIPVNSLKQGKIMDAEFPAFMRANDSISRLSIWVDDTPGINATELRAKCLETEARAGGLDLVIVDYLQLMQGDGRKRPYEQVSDNAKALKQIARDLNLPVLCLSQLNRSCEGRLNKRPMLSDLRESGVIEEAANQVFFIYRDEVYNEATETPNIAEVIVAKNRDGAIGTCALYFEKALTRFLDAEIRITDVNGEWL